jgi:Glycosyltransferase family 87
MNVPELVVAAPGARPVPGLRRAGLEGALGAIGLAVIALCAVWLPARAAVGGYLLHLPADAHPAWVEGPLRGLGAIFGPAGPAAFDAGVVLMGVAYLAALVGAPAVPWRLVLAAISIATLGATLGPTLVSSDVFGYIAYARLHVVHGLNPYVFAPIAAPHDPILHLVFWRDATSPYGPLFTIVSDPLGLISTGAALWIYKAMAGVSSIGIALLLAKAAPSRGIDRRRAAVLFALNPVVLIYAVSGAHNDLIATLLLAAATAMALRGGVARAGAMAVAAAAIKLTFGLAVPFLIIGSRSRGAGRAATGAAGAAVAAAAVTFALFGGHIVDQLHRIAADSRFDIAWSGPDRAGAAFGSGITASVRTVCLASAGVLCLALLIWAARRADWITALGWATLALLASIPSLAPWYLVWLLPPASLTRSRALRNSTVLLTGYLLAVHLPLLGGRPWLSRLG